MNAYKGYYSLVQYCPDAARAESANIGALLFCPELKFINVRVSGANDRIRTFFKTANVDLAAVKLAKESLLERIESERGLFATLDDLVQFAQTRANDIILTHPRPIRVESPEADLERLFKELVGGRAARKKAIIPELNEIDRYFRTDALKGRIQYNKKINLPIGGGVISIPYVYQNGTRNLIKPQSFAVGAQGRGDAHQLASEGHILQSRPDEVGLAQKLFVIPIIGESERNNGFGKALDDIFGFFKIKTIHLQNLPKFIKIVEQEAQPIQ
jgi:hypothetical protein